MTWVRWILKGRKLGKFHRPSGGSVLAEGYQRTACGVLIRRGVPLEIMAEDALTEHELCQRCWNGIR